MDGVLTEIFVEQYLTDQQHLESTLTIVAVWLNLLHVNCQNKSL